MVTAVLFATATIWKHPSDPAQMAGQGDSGARAHTHTHVGRLWHTHSHICMHAIDRETMVYTDTHTHTLEYYLATRIDGSMQFAATWVGLENALPSGTDTE